MIRCRVLRWLEQYVARDHGDLIETASLATPFPAALKPESATDECFKTHWFVGNMEGSGTRYCETCKGWVVDRPPDGAQRSDIHTLPTGHIHLGLDLSDALIDACHLALEVLENDDNDLERARRITLALTIIIDSALYYEPLPDVQCACCGETDQP